MVTRKPSIFIYTHDPDRDFLKEIRAGIEEEGISSDVFERDEDGAADLAHKAANDSMLGSGIGLSGVNAVLSMRGLKEYRSVEAYHMPTYAEARRLGENSARLIKRLGLKEA
ncbi:MAG: glycerol dehydratase reactivase beta/small subunit family protein [Eubacterium sp.]|nr:glycerol dehydratase reactivase beta/small subunit family protein [Eubacterium sp.]